MHGYTELATQERLDDLTRRLAHFHDSLLKELRVAERGWVGADAAMQPPTRLDARLLVQSQRHLRALELVAIGVRSLTLHAHDPHCAGAILSGRLEQRHVRGPVERGEIEVELDGALTLVCDRLFAAERPEWHGPTARLDGEVPAPDAVPARELGAGQRQCSVCATPFDAAGAGAFAWCPGCTRLTARMAADGGTDPHRSAPAGS